MDRLPEELQLRILEHLHTIPPSERKARQEPKLDLTLAEEQPLKVASCLSKQWRRITLPLLFRHTCLRIDGLVKDAWRRCCLHNETSLKFLESDAGGLPSVDEYHMDMLQASPRTAANMDTTSSVWLRRNRGANNANAYENDSKVWASRMYHASKDFLDFISSHCLGKHVTSFVLLSDSMHLGKVEQLPSPVQYDWRYEASAVLWQHLLSVINPETIAIVAPPMELACFCNSFVTLSSGKSLCRLY